MSGAHGRPGPGPFGGYGGAGILGAPPPPPPRPVVLFTYVDGQGTFAAASNAPLAASLRKLGAFPVLRVIFITPLPPDTDMAALEAVGVGRVEDMSVE